MGRPSVITGSLNVDEGGRRVSIRVTQCEKDCVGHLLALEMEWGHEPRNVGSL